jgi:hypothetical protein
MRELLNTLRNETETTIRVLFALQAFNELLRDKTNVNKVNENVYFWLIFESSLNTKLLIGIRRLFENKSGTFNFQKFIDLCKKDIFKFSKASFEKRRIEEAGAARPEWLDDYLKTVYTPTKEDFNELSKLVRNCSKKMKGVYSDAASTIFAHAVHTDTTVIQNMLSKIRFDEMEVALNALWHVYEQVWQMYHNGRKPLFEISAYPHKDEVVNSVIKQLKM